MKKLVLLSVFALLIGTSVSAQKHGMRDFDPDEKAEKKVEKVSETVELDEKQKAALIEVHADYYAKKKAMIQSGEKDRESMKALKESKKERVKTILGSDEKYEAYREAVRKDRKHHRKGMKHSDPKERAEAKAEKVSEKLELNEKEQASLTQIYTKHFMKAKMMHESDEMDKEAMKKLREEKMTQVKTALRPEKYEAYEEMMQERKKRHRMHKSDTERKGGKHNHKK